MASEPPIHELKHDAKPGYPQVFFICFALMSLYLAFIIYSSPGQVKSEYHGKKEGYQNSHPADQNTEGATKH